MKTPVVADNKPAKVVLEAGKEYFFCTCGRSANQPFCDASHVGTEFTPKAFTAQSSGDAWLCVCKHTHTAPFCDGSHKQFSRAAVGKPGPGISPVGAAVEVIAPAPLTEQPTPVNTTEESALEFVHQLAREGLQSLGAHGPIAAMGVPRHSLPRWDDIQIMVAQLASKPLQEDAGVGTGLVIGPEAKRPLQLNIPLLISDMSFGALSAEAKIALAKGAELAGTGICSGEGGMLPQEQQSNSRYFYELASAQFGYREALLAQVQAFHFKGGQAAKTGTGGYLPACKNVGQIAQVRGLPEGTAALSPPTFKYLRDTADFVRFAGRVREITGGIPVGFKLSANHIERDIEFALQAGADYIILDGRGGGTGAAPLLFRDHISVPTIPALARARRYLDRRGASGRVTLIITGGLRVPSDFIKALALGADGIALANSAMQSIGCVAARICHTNNCPAGIATQNQDLRQRLNIDKSAGQLANFLQASTALMQVMARACGHHHLNQFTLDDLATWQRDMAYLSGIAYCGITPP